MKKVLKLSMAVIDGLSIGLLIFIITASISGAILKAIAMWKAAKNNEKGWYIVLFIFNTAGILPLIYILMRRKNQSM